MTNNFDIVQVRVRETYSEEDAQQLAQYGMNLAFETEGKQLTPELVLEGVKNLMKRPKLGKYFLAERFDSFQDKWMPIGTSMLTFEVQPRLGGLIYFIQSVYIESAYRNKGVFRKIYQTIVDSAKADSFVKAVRLYVEHDNKTAQMVYSALGMGKVETFAFDEIDFVFSH